MPQLLTHGPLTLFHRCACMECCMCSVLAPFGLVNRYVFQMCFVCGFLGPLPLVHRCAPPCSVSMAFSCLFTGVRACRDMCVVLVVPCGLLTGVQARCVVCLPFLASWSFFLRGLCVLSCAAGCCAFVCLLWFLLVPGVLGRPTPFSCGVCLPRDVRGCLAPGPVPWLWSTTCLSGVPPAFVRRALSRPVAPRVPMGLPIPVVPSLTRPSRRSIYWAAARGRWGQAENWACCAYRWPLPRRGRCDRSALQLFRPRGGVVLGRSLRSRF